MSALKLTFIRDLSLIEGALIVMRETSGHKTLANVALEALARMKGVG